MPGGSEAGDGIPNMGLTSMCWVAARKSGCRCAQGQQRMQSSWTNGWPSLSGHPLPRPDPPSQTSAAALLRGPAWSPVSQIPPQSLLGNGRFKAYSCWLSFCFSFSPFPHTALVSETVPTAPAVIPPLLLVLLLPPTPTRLSQTSVPAWSEQAGPMSSVGGPTLPVRLGPGASRAPGRS